MITDTATTNPLEGELLGRHRGRVRQEPGRDGDAPPVRHRRRFRLDFDQDILESLFPTPPQAA